ncbi:hypothetical protein PP583_gp04 [Pseudoalteromonas phage HS6]|nr:hypothetical protein PP583_gp04 [Pseudoalteromonas phage HS6]
MVALTFTQKIIGYYGIYTVLV